MAEEDIICDEQKRVFAYGYVERSVVDPTDHLLDFVKTDDYIIITTKRQSTVFVREDNDEYILQFLCRVDHVSHTYHVSDEKNDIYNRALSHIHKTIDDVEPNYILETYVVFKEYNKPLNQFLFEYIDYDFHFTHSVTIRISSALP